MTMLPDIDAGSWLDFQRNRVKEEMDNRLKGFDLGQAINERTSGLQELAGSLTAPEPTRPQAPAAPMPTPQMAPAPEPSNPFAQASMPTQQPQGAPEPTNPFAGIGQPFADLGSAVRQVIPAPPEPTRPSPPTRPSARPSAAGGGTGGFTGPAPARVGQGQADFTASLQPLAQNVAARTGIDPNVMIAIAANETGWGQSKNAKEQNNLFSIQGPSGQASRWATYDSPEQSFQAFADLISTAPRYRQAWAVRDNPDAFVDELRKAGYVADEPGYPAQGWVNQVKSINARLPAIEAGGGITRDTPLLGGLVQAGQRAGAALSGEPSWLGMAKEQLNKPYIWGSGSGAGGRGTGDIDPQTGLPKGFDCSGYVSWVLKNGLGVDIPAYTGSAYDKTTAIDASTARPGDIVFYNMGNPDPHMQHMALYIGDGKIIQAGGTQRNVNIASVNSVGAPEFRRAAGTDAAESRNIVGAAVQGASGLASDVLGGIRGAASGVMGAAQAAQQRIEAGLGEMEQSRAGLVQDLQQRMADLNRQVAENDPARGFQQRMDQLGALSNQLTSFGGEAASQLGSAVHATGLRQPSETVMRQFRGEEPAAFGLTGPVVGALGAIGELTQGPSAAYPSGGPLAGLLTGGLREQGGIQAQTSQFEQAAGMPYGEFERRVSEDLARVQAGLQAEPDPELTRLRLLQNEMINQRGASAAYAQLPKEEQERIETTGGLASGIWATGLVPGGMQGGAGGLARTIAATAIDPLTPFGAIPETLGGLRRVPEVAAGGVSNIVESAARYTPGGLEDQFEQAARASSASSPDRLAHLDLGQLDSPFELTANEIASKTGGVASVYIPHLDEIRAMVENGLDFSQWYTQMAERAAQAFGEGNLAEFATNFGITSQRTRVEDNLAESLRMGRIVREAAADAVSKGLDGREAALKRLADMTTKEEGGVLGDVGGLAGNQKKTSIINAYTQGGIESAGPKTPSYIGNFLSAFNALYDPRTTNDTWVAQMFGVRGDTPLNRYANNDRAYRFAEVALNEIAREMGIPGHQAQAAAWYSMQRLREQAPDLYHSIGVARGTVEEKKRKYVTGGSTLGDALRAARERGLFEAESTGQAGAWDLPKVQAELAKIAAMPEAVRTMPNPTGVDMMRRYAGKYKGAERVPSSPEFRAQERGLAGTATPTVNLPALPLDRLREEGLLTETGLLPALRATPHRVTELADGSTMLSLPGGNSDTARYVASVFGEALGADNMTIAFPDIASKNAGGLALQVDPGRIDEVMQALGDVGANVVAGVDRTSIHIPLTVANQQLLDTIGATISGAGDAVRAVRDYTGEAEDIGRQDYAGHLEAGRSRFAPTGSERPDLLARTVDVLREGRRPDWGAGTQPSEWDIAQPSPWPWAKEPQRDFGGAVAELLPGGVGGVTVPVTRGAIQGAVGGGYSAAQEEGATPQDVALGILGGGLLGGARGSVGPQAAGIGRLGVRAADAMGEPLKDASDGFDELFVPGRQPAPELQQILGPAGELLSTIGRKGSQFSATRTARAAEETDLEGFTAATARQATAAQADVDPAIASRLPNLSKIAEDMPDIQASLIAHANVDPEIVDAYKQGRITHAQIENTLAKRFGLTKEQYLKSKVGQAFNQNELLALRAYVEEEKVRLRELSTEAAEQMSKRGGIDKIDVDLKARLVDGLIDAGRLQAIATGAGSTAARTLNSMKIKMTDALSAGITSGIEAREAKKALAEQTKRAEKAAEKAAALEAKAKQRALDKAEALQLREQKRIQAEADRLAAAAQRRIDAAEKKAGRAKEIQMGKANKALEALKIDGKITDKMLEEYIKLQNSGDELAFGRFLHGIQKTSGWERFDIMRYASMLSSAATHGTQAASNLVQLGLRPAIHAASVPVDIAGNKILGSERQRYWGELPEMWTGVKEGLRVGREEAAEVLKSGVNVRQVARDPEHVRPGFGMEQTRLGKLIGERGSEAVNIGMEAPLRAMSASDLLFQGAARGMHTRSLAARQAIKEGYQGGEIGTRVQEIMDNLLDADFKHIRDEADELARKVTLQEENWAARLPRNGLGRIASLAIPFIRTPYNVVAQGMGLTPLGLLNLARKGGREGGAAQETIAKATIGSMIMGGTLALAAEDHLTAGYPQDEWERSTLPKGWRPWSARIVGEDGNVTYIPYASLGPIGVPMAIGAAAGRAIRDGREEKDIMPELASATMSIGRYMADQSMLQGLNNFINMVTEPQRYGDKVIGSALQQFVPYGALQRQMLGALGVSQRDPLGIGEAFERGEGWRALTDPMAATSLPFAQTVQPKLSPLGEEVAPYMEGLGALSPLRYGQGKDEPVLQTLRGAEVNIPEAAKTYRGIPLTGPEQRQQQIAAGPLIRQVVAEIMADPRFEGLSGYEKQIVLERAIERARAAASVGILEPLGEPELQRRLLEERIRTAPGGSIPAAPTSGPIQRGPRPSS